MISPAAGRDGKEPAAMAVGARQTMMIGGQSVEVTREDIPQTRLRFYEAKPRVYSHMRRNGKNV